METNKMLFLPLSTPNWNLDDNFCNPPKTITPKSTTNHLSCSSTSKPATQRSPFYSCFHLLLFAIKAALLPTMQRMLLKHGRLHVVGLSMRSLNGSRSSNSPAYVGETTFDTNMVIILAALLCALIGALGVNSIVRCALRCRRSFAAGSAEEAAAREAVAGLEKKELGRIPVVVYGGGGSIKGTECPICLSEFEDGDKVRILPKCNHGFHVRCIDTWLVSHSSCPNCRHSLFEQPSDSSQQLGGSPSTQQSSSISVVIDGSGTN